jgi:L-alanine-DL-glutamate epimerase-like enolase superfamily enzyme
VTRIADIGLHHLRVPFRRPVRFGASEADALDVLVVRVVGDDGQVGWGEVPTGRGPSPIGEADVLGTLVQLAGLLGGTQRRPSTKDEVPLDEMPLPPARQALTDPSADLLAALSGPGIGAGLATAVLDLVGRQLGRSLAGLLGMGPSARVGAEPSARVGAEPSARVAVNGLVRADRPDPEGVVEESATQLATGIRTLKLKAGEPAELEAALRAIRGAFGSDVRLRVDWNGRLDPAEAADQLRRLEWADLEYVEDPIPAAAGPGGFARLRRASPVPIAADEPITDPETAAVFLAAGACDVLVVKPARLGGPLVARRVVGLATDRGVPVTVSSLYETGIGLAAALHVAATVPGDRAHGLATADLLADDLLVEPLAVADGRIALPAGPGLGVEVDEAAVARYKLDGREGRRR